MSHVCVVSISEKIQNFRGSQQMIWLCLFLCLQNEQALFTLTGCQNDHSQGNFTSSIYALLNTKSFIAKYA